MFCFGLDCKMLPHSRILLKCILNSRNVNKLLKTHNVSAEVTRNYQINPALCTKKIAEQEVKETLSTGTEKYMEFRDEDSHEIFDVDEERSRLRQQLPTLDAPTYDHNEFNGLNLKRGETNVFDIEDLVDVLHKENAEDLFVCSVPKSLNYVDYLVVCSGRSYRHMLAIAEFVRRMYKIKRCKSDIMPRIEGKQSRNWMAMDLGNIALHIMTAEARETYDLESLWAIGAEYDNEYNKPKDPLVELFEKSMMLFADVQANQNANKPIKDEPTSSTTTK